MVELGCQDTDWVGESDKAVLDGILPRDGLILLVWHFVNFSIKKAKSPKDLDFSEFFPFECGIFL